jgi:hypothetical protein
MEYGGDYKIKNVRPTAEKADFCATNYQWTYFGLIGATKGSERCHFPY